MSYLRNSACMYVGLLYCAMPVQGLPPVVPGDRMWWDLDH